MAGLSYELNYSYEDAPTLLKFNRSRKRIKAVLGPFSSGKSSACVVTLFENMLDQDPYDMIRKTKFAVVRNTTPQLHKTTIPTFFHWIPPLHFGSYNKTQNLFTIRFPREGTLPDGTAVYSEVHFIALDRPEHVANLLSLELTGAWLNEYREISKVIFDAMDGRINRYPSRREHGATYPFIIMDSNPPDYDHWSYKLFEEELPLDQKLRNKMVLFRQPSGRSDDVENLRNNDPDYYHELAIGKDKEYIRVYIDGEYGYVKSGKPVYQNYSDVLHLAEKDIEPMKGLPIVVGMDFGLQVAAIFAQYTPDGHFNILRELTSEPGTTARSFLNNDLVPTIKAYYPEFKIIVVGDPAGKSRSESDGNTCYKEIKKVGLRSIQAKTNSLQARLSAVDSLLMMLRDDHRPALQLSPSCAVLRKGFMGEYKYPEIHSRHGDTLKDSPLKNSWSHPHDALQYAALGYESMDEAKEMEANRSQKLSGKKRKTKRDAMKGYT